MSNTVNALVSCIRYEAEGINSIELCPVNEGSFETFEPGSHIDLHLPNGMVRSYSLLNSPTEKDRYVVGVLRDKKSRGGSEWIHSQLRVGSELSISTPRNNFPLELSASHSVLVAGGIGITPILCMFRALLSQGQSAELIYCARSRKEAAMQTELAGLSQQYGAKVHYHFDDEQQAPPSLKALLAGRDPSTHFYCCGPLPMLDAFEQSCTELGYNFAHIERFNAVEVVAAEDAQESYLVELAKSGQIIQIGAGDVLLERLLDAGVTVDCSCREGVCGSCEVAVLSGDVDHRDGVLTNSEKAANKTMMVCVSGCKSAKLVLDL